MTLQQELTGWTAAAQASSEAGQSLARQVGQLTTDLSAARRRIAQLETQRDILYRDNCGFRDVHDRQLACQERQKQTIADLRKQLLQPEDEA